MRILLYTFFLVAIATIAVGSPVNNMMMPQLLKRDSVPICDDEDYPKYLFSSCTTATSMEVVCSEDDDQEDFIELDQDCEPGDICIDHLSTLVEGEDNPIPHATCVNGKNIKKWDNFNALSKEACTLQAYKNSNGPTDIQIGIMTYSTNETPMQVFTLRALYQGKQLEMVQNNHHYTATIKDYDQGKITYCFNENTENEAIGYAAAFDMRTNPYESLPRL